MAGLEYHEPTTLSEAVELLDRYEGDAKIIAGGQSLLILMAEGFVRPPALVALQGIPELGDVTAEDDLLVGANVTHERVNRDSAIRRHWPLLARVAGSVATIQVRNRGTLCGSVAHGFPLSDPPAALLALDARAHVVGPGGERTVPIEEFFLGFLTTQLAPKEVLAHVSVPAVPTRTGGAYEALRARPLDFPIVGVAARLTLDVSGGCVRARLGLTGGGPTPMRALSAEALLEGQTVSEDTIAAAAQAAAEEAEPTEDIDGSVEYKRRVLRVLAARTLQGAYREALGSDGAFR